MTDTTEYTRDGQLRSDNPASLPDVIDILVVGGGPAGTAVAFRARELGLTALVIDFDDLMKRIRDYSKDKAIIPSFGGGDKMAFPNGGPLISLLQFAAMDKDTMCETWKGFYRQHNIHAQIGVELVSLDPSDAQQIWRAGLWNHRTKEEQTCLAKHVVLTVGRGVPRRLDIPGNCEGLSYRLTDPQAYVGASACVIGGGTSAAEAVIAISQAKAEQQDNTPLFWSYRGDKMPRVSKALADAFFDAYLGNGNIRYYPKSDPVAVVTASDHEDYLAIRTESRLPTEEDSGRHYLEVHKNFCLACIGEDVPEQFFESLGISMVAAAGSRRKKMIVTEQLETNLPNVFLAGDILSQSYFQTDDFDANPDTFRRIEHRGNIKAALNDGVLVAEAIQRRMAGGGPAAAVPSSSKSMVSSEPLIEKAAQTNDFSTKKGSKHDSPDPEITVLRRLLPGDVEADEYELKSEGVTTVGRSNCDIALPDDTLLAPFHASLTRNHRGTTLRDESEDGGVFLKLSPGRPVVVSPGTILRAGRQFLVFADNSDAPVLMHYDHAGQECHRCRLSRQFVVLGRQADLSLDESDMSLSRRHLAVSSATDGIHVKDLNSVNGTFMKMVKSCRLSHGTEFKIGNQLFRFLETARHESLLPAATQIELVENHTIHNRQAGVSGNENGLPQHSAEENSKISVRVQGIEQPILAQRGQTIYDTLAHSNLDIVAECQAGVCGSDPIRILSGRDNLSLPQEEEHETLTDLCHLDARDCRLACVARIQGPIELEIINS